jgi:DNA-binding transcriptional LysR family regulator
VPEVRRLEIETSLAATMCAMVARGLGVSVVSGAVIRELQLAGVHAIAFEPAIQFDCYVIRPRQQPEQALVASRRWSPISSRRCAPWRARTRTQRKSESTDRLREHARKLGIRRAMLRSIRPPSRTRQGVARWPKVLPALADGACSVDRGKPNFFSR